MPFRINHYASRVLDSSGSLLGERIATKILMLIVLIGFGYWLYNLRYFWGVVFFGLASLPIGISLVMALFSLFAKFLKWLKIKDGNEKNT